MGKSLTDPDNEEKGELYTRVIKRPKLVPALQISIDDDESDNGSSGISRNTPQPQEQCWCHNRPYFTIFFALLQIAFYIYQWHDVNQKLLMIFRVDLRKRHEVWRLITPMLAHDTSNIHHIATNTFYLLLFGITLERIHKWRMPLIYITGVISGSMVFSVLVRFMTAIGASAGVYALYGAHVGDLIVNWKNRWERFTIHFGAYFAFTLWRLLSDAFRIICEHGWRSLETESNKFYRKETAHIAGFLCGLLMGIAFFHRTEEKPWKFKLKVFALFLFIVVHIGFICVTVLQST